MKKEKGGKFMFGLICLSSMSVWKTIGLICTFSGAVLELGSAIADTVKDSEYE